MSIIIPTHNEAGFICGLLDSIFHTLKENFEVLIVDNGSNDDTVEICQEYSCRIIQLPEKVYPGVARNTGVKASKGELLVFLDADVLLTTEWNNQLELLRKNQLRLPKQYLTGAPYALSRSPSWIERYWFEPLSLEDKDYINGGNIILPREVFNKIGGFDESLETGEDVDLSFRATHQGIPVEIDRLWKVHHEGFPKNVKNFLRRETWHGKGDFSSLNNIISSKIAIATVLFMLSHIFVLFSIANLLPAIFLTVSLVFIISLCFYRAKKGCRIGNAKTFLYRLYLSYIYFTGRSMSCLSMFRQKFLS